MTKGSMQLAGIVSDMRYAMRLVRRERVYTLTAIVAIALGVRLVIPRRSWTRFVRSSANRRHPLVMDSVMTMEDRVMSSVAKARTYAFILAVFAFFALTIAAVGLFGVLSYSVARRTREIGVRTALGARTSDIVQLVLAQGAFITAVGLAVGLAVSTIVVRSMSTILFGVQPHDTTTFLAVPLALAAVAALACAGPAVRAAKIDPLRALRSN